jgi:hypothetical protein
MLISMSFVAKLPTSNAATIDIRITEVHIADMKLLQQWDRDVVPQIKADPNRADAKWPPWFPIIGVATLGLVRRKGRIFHLAVATTDTPAAMIAILEQERWIEDHRQAAVFVWYVSTAPSAYFQKCGIANQPKLLGRAALDIAVTLAMPGPAKGKLWLHADRNGGSQLACWYGTETGLTKINPAAIPQLPGLTLLSNPFPRNNDGRYFCLTEDTAEWAHKGLDEWR